MKAAPEDLDAQHLFQADIAQMNLLAEMSEECELAWLIRCLKDGDFQPKRFGEAVRNSSVQGSIVGKCANPGSTLSGLNDELYRACVEPALTAVDCFSQRFVCKG